MILIEHARSLSLRQGPWKYIEPNNGPQKNEATGIELGNDGEPQLYNLADDPGETRNLAKENRAKLAELVELLAAEKGKTR